MEKQVEVNKKRKEETSLDVRIEQKYKNCRRNKFIQSTVLEKTLLKATNIGGVVVGRTENRKGWG